MRLVLDTDVVIAAFRSDRGASRQLLLAALERNIVLLVSVPLMLEYEAASTRPEQLSAAGITVENVATVLDALAAVLEPVRMRYLWRPSLKDPADEMVLATAVDGRADCLVAFNVRHFDMTAKQFGLEVLRPGEVLWRLRGEEHDTK